MKSDKSKWKTLSIKNRLKKGFRLTTFVASASGVIAGILMILVSMRYSSALTFYGFSQGDIGKVMVTFSETRSATRALIGYTASDTLSKMSDTHDSKKESFQKYWKELQSSIKTDEEQAIYDDINSKLDSYWSLDDEIGQLGRNATDPETQKEAEERAVADLVPAYDDIYQQLVALMDTKVTDGDNLSKRLSLVSYAVFGIVIVIIVSSYFISMKIGDEVAVGISKPLDELKQRLRTFAQGDLEAPFPAVDSQDEIADMVGVAKNMAADLKTIISDSDKLLGKTYIEHVHSIRKSLMKYTQVLLFSASIDKKTRKEANNLTFKPIDIDINSIKASESVIPSTIKHNYVITDRRERIETLRKLIKAVKPSKAIIFINTKYDLEESLQKLLYHNYNVGYLSSNADATTKRNTLDKFRSGKLQLLLATDIAARGLQIDDIDVVINVNLPEESKEYIHRVGRCGRNGNQGLALSIITENETNKIKKYQKEFHINMLQKKLYQGRLVAK